MLFRSHNDANPGNVLFTGDDVSGIIDFGDMVRGTRVQELAVAGAYLYEGDGPYLESVAALVGGYLRVAPLPWEQVALLPGLLRTRALLSLVITSWLADTAEHEAEERRAVLPRSVGRLERFWNIEAEGGLERLRAAWEEAR